MSGAWVEARCAGGHLWFRLDPDRALIEVRCARRSCAHDGPAVHLFDARTGEEVREPTEDATAPAEPDGEPR